MTAMPTSPRRSNSTNPVVRTGRARSRRAAFPLPMLSGSLTDLIARPGMHPVLLAGSKDPNAKLTVVLIDECGPAFAVKVPTTEASAAVVRAEGETLALLHRASLGALAPTIPRPIGYIAAGGFVGLVTGAVAGTPMAVAYHAWRHTAAPRRVRADFDAAGDWLAGLQRRTATAACRMTLLHDSLDRIETRFGPQPALRARLAPVADRLATQLTPRTAVHGDYWFGNLLTDKGQVVGVVDWEAGRLIGEPVIDIARFAVTYSLYLDRHVLAGARIPGHRGLRNEGWGAGLVRAVTGPGWYHELVIDFIASALERLGVDRACASAVLLAGIADVAATADHPEFARSHLDLLAGLDLAAIPS
jgi:aminoglycoside phosphotransferase (APT) family kinase protein